MTVEATECHKPGLGGAAVPSRGGGILVGAEDQENLCKKGSKLSNVGKSFLTHSTEVERTTEQKMAALSTAHAQSTSHEQYRWLTQ